MKKRWVILVSLIIFLSSLVSALPASNYDSPCNTVYGGINVCNKCFDCGADETENPDILSPVCPQDSGQIISTATQARTAITRCGGTGPSTEQITISCLDDCNDPLTIDMFCNYGIAGWCKFCFNAADCPSPQPIQSEVTGTVYYTYSPYYDPNCFIPAGSSQTCTQDSQCTTGVYCSKGEYDELASTYWHCCASGKYWDAARQSCQDAVPCGYEPTFQCPYPITDYRFWITSGCFYTDPQNTEYACCPGTQAYGETGIYYDKIIIEPPASCAGVTVCSIDYICGGDDGVCPTSFGAVCSTTSGDACFDPDCPVPNTPPTVSLSYSGTCENGETITLTCAATDADGGSLNVKLWAGQCDCADCLNTRAWATASTSDTVYYEGAVMPLSSENYFQSSFIIDQPGETCIAATCRATDSQGAASNWSDLYPLANCEIPLLTVENGAPCTANSDCTSNNCINDLGTGFQVCGPFNRECVWWSSSKGIHFWDDDAGGCAGWCGTDGTDDKMLSCDLDIDFTSDGGGIVVKADRGTEWGNACCTYGGCSGTAVPGGSTKIGWQVTPDTEDLYSCTDGFDNDCDGFIDGDDPDCVATIPTYSNYYKVYRAGTGSDGEYGLKYWDGVAENTEDKAECLNANDCVYNGNCFTADNYYDLDSDSLIDMYCIDDSGSGEWLNVDYYNSWCTGRGFNWNVGFGDARADDDYYSTVTWYSHPDACVIDSTDNPSLSCCCGDDAGENYITIGGGTACCASATACVDPSGNCQAGTESGAALCSDGIDNDCDGKIDCADENCAGQIGQSGNKCCYIESDIHVGCSYIESCSSNECIDAKTGYEESCCLNYCECLGAVELFNDPNVVSCVSEIDALSDCDGVQNNVITIITECLTSRDAYDTVQYTDCLNEIHGTTAYKTCP